MWSRIISCFPYQKFDIPVRFLFNYIYFSGLVCASVTTYRNMETIRILLPGYQAIISIWQSPSSYLVTHYITCTVSPANILDTLHWILGSSFHYLSDDENLPETKNVHVSVVCMRNERTPSFAWYNTMDFLIYNITFNSDMSIACDALILLSDVFLSVLPL